MKFNVKMNSQTRKPEKYRDQKGLNEELKEFSVSLRTSPKRSSGLNDSHDLFQENHTDVLYWVYWEPILDLNAG